MRQLEDSISLSPKLSFKFSATVLSLSPQNCRVDPKTRVGLSSERVEILLLVAAAVAMLARRLHVPNEIGLVVAGIALALLPFSPNIELTKELLFTALLPPLIFEAAFYLHWHELHAASAWLVKDLMRI